MGYKGGGSAAGAIMVLVAVVWAVAAWFTHVIVCIQNEQWLFLIAGAIMAPIAVIHGTGLWFGLF